MGNADKNTEEEQVEKPTDEELGLVNEVAKEEFLATDLQIGLTSTQVEESREKWGTNEISTHVTPSYVIFLRQFTGFLQVLIEIAAIITLALQDWTDFVIIISILIVNAFLGFREEYKAKKALDELSNSLESEITVRRDGQTTTVPTKELVPGDVCLLVGGNVVSADIKWIKGDTMLVDTAPLTGEPLPRKYPSDDYGAVLLNGTTIVAGECYGQVLMTGANTEMGKAQADVLKDKSVRVISVFERKVMHVVQMLVSVCLGITLSVLLVKGFVYDGFKENVTDTILAALSIMIASIPVALPLVLKVNMALGASYLAKNYHAIVTSIPALQDIASMSMLCSDKTGTLTTANMSIIVNRIIPVNDFSQTDVIRYGYLCSNPDKQDDPIDAAVVRAFLESEIAEEKSEYEQTEIIGFNPNVKRVVSFVKRGDQKFTIAKGLPSKIIDTEAGGVDDHVCQWKVQNHTDKAFTELIRKADVELSKAGYKTIAIAMCEGDGREDDHGVWKFVGLMPMLDPPREDTRATIESLHRANISVKMITGDHVNVARETARLIGLGTDIRAGEEIRKETSQQVKNEMIWNADGFAAVLPSDKREVVMTLKNGFGIVTGMTGDGVNDSPALSAAQVGIAVEGATDAARNAADLILTEPGLSPIYFAVLEARRIFARLKAYVVYRVAASIIVVLTLCIIIFATGCTVEALLIILLALFNDISMLPIAYDNASATSKPQLPKASKLVLMSLYYGVLQSAFSLVFIFSMNYSKHTLGLTSTCDTAAQSFIWLHLELVTELAIFSVRAPSYFFLSIPSPWLLSSVLGTCIMCCLIAVFARELPGADVGWIWLFNIATFIVVDAGKVCFLEAIDNAPGEIIVSDELVEVDESKTDFAKYKEKEGRYFVHRRATLEAEDLEHSIETVNAPRFFQLSSDSFTDGYLNRRQRELSLFGQSRSPPTRRHSRSLSSRTV